MRLLIVLLLTMSGAGFARAFVDFGWLVVKLPLVLIPLLIGTVIGIFLDRYLERLDPRIGIFEHELTHAIAAVLWLRRVERFVVRRDGGWVQHSSGFGGVLADDFIGLAPYFLPTFLMASVLLRPLVPQPLLPIMDLWLGATFGFHARSTYRETRLGVTSQSFRMAGTSELVQSDIARRGVAYSLFYALSITIACHGFVIAVIAEGYAGVVRWGGVVAGATWPLVVWAADWLLGWAPLIHA